MIVECVSNTSDFERLAPEWDALADRFDTPMLRHARGGVGACEEAEAA